MSDDKLPQPHSKADIHKRALRLHGSIARDLGIQIVSGQLKPGELLGNEVSASDKLQVSRGAYREAVRILAAKGLVESRPKVGTRVSKVEQWHLLDPDILSWIFEFEPSRKMLQDLFELRHTVEPQAAALAAKRRSEKQLQEMEKALATMSNHTLSSDAGLDADMAFHKALLEASDNAFIISMTSGISAAVAWTTVFKQRKHPLLRDPIPDHIQVFEAVKAADADAAHKAMQELIDLAWKDTTYVWRT